MTHHPYLRAYMAGIAVPTPLLLVGMTVFCVLRFVYNVPVPIERVIVFPLAIVPNLWGLWNMLFLRLHSRRPYAIGLHGLILPFIIAPLGFTIMRVVGFQFPEHFLSVLPIVFPGGLIFYYLAWKYLVGFLNGLLGIA